MGIKKQVILLEVPNVIQGPETYTVDGFTCPECKGQGWVWREDPDDPDARPDGWIRKACPVCGGTGLIEAEVTVNWKKQGGES